MMAALRCVVVDDDTDFLNFVAEWLSRIRSDWEIVRFQSALEALDYVTRHPVDLVLTDYKMPEMDGLQLTDHVRSLEINVPIVVMSGNPIEAQALAIGATAFLRKVEIPVRLREVIESLKAVNAHTR